MLKQGATARCEKQNNKISGVYTVHFNISSMCYRRLTYIAIPSKNERHTHGKIRYVFQCNDKIVVETPLFDLVLRHAKYIVHNVLYVNLAAGGDKYYKSCLCTTSTT